MVNYDLTTVKIAKRIKSKETSIAKLLILFGYFILRCLFFVTRKNDRGIRWTICTLWKWNCSSGFHVQVFKRQNNIRRHFISSNCCYYPADTQRHEDVHLWSYFGWDAPDLNGSKVGGIKFLTYFGSAISGMHLGSGNKEKFP